MLSMWNGFEPSVPRKALVRERITQTVRNEAGVTGREYGASGGLGAGCVWNEQPHTQVQILSTPGRRWGPVGSCDGRGLSRGMCEGPRAGSWRQKNSSLNENIKSKMGISPSSAREDAVGGGWWTWWTCSSRPSSHPACLLAILSNHPCLYRSQQPMLLSAVNVVWPHISDKSHSPALSLEGILFFYRKSTEEHTLLHLSCRCEF